MLIFAGALGWLGVALLIAALFAVLGGCCGVFITLLCKGAFGCAVLAAVETLGLLTALETELAAGVATGLAVLVAVAVAAETGRANEVLVVDDVGLTRGPDGFPALLREARGAGLLALEMRGLLPLALAGSEARGAPGRVAVGSEGRADGMREVPNTDVVLADVGVTEPLGAELKADLLPVNLDALSMASCAALITAFAAAADVGGFETAPVAGPDTEGFLKVEPTEETGLGGVAGLRGGNLGVSVLAAGRERSEGEGAAGAATLGAALN